MSLNNKIALVTGGSRGLGKNTALRLAQNGSDVIVTYRKEKEAAEKIVSEITGMGKKAAALQLDVGDIGALDAFVADVSQAVSDKWNRNHIDILVNNAGIIAIEMIVETSEETFDRLMNIHLKGVYFLTQKLLPKMAEGGHIVNFSSGLARFSFPGYSAYACMKGAVEVFTRYLAKELGDRKITANVVAPGPVATDMNKDRFESDPQMVEMLSSLTALDRVGQVDDIGGVVAFLCSDEAGWVNGQRIEVSGGMIL
ncbi:Oxidoreductase, short-chain dehydrogenase/reductase family [Olavius algarvensis associated proteobacterium Delta 3]|nr:Oxidoreductase, short-chain dehydrogenase/reductase family [Olavius algarvensis associated proteobacterium Delta 3]